MGVKQFGARVTRLEDPALLSGRGRFVDDVKLAGTLHACFVRSPHAHARIRSIDARRRGVMPGVHAVLTADDLPEPMRSERMPMLLPNPVDRRDAAPNTRWRATRSAMSASRSRSSSRTAAISPRTRPRMVLVDYDVLPPISDCRDAFATARRARTAISTPTSRLDLPPGLRRCRRRLRRRRACVRGGDLAAPRRRHGDRDPRRAGELRCRRATCSRSGRGRRRRISAAACSPTSSAATSRSIRMIAPDVGGGFGPKAMFYPEEAVIPAAAMKLGRPVKWIEDRREHFLCATQERDQYWKVAIAVDANGKHPRRARQRCCTTPARSCRGASSCPISRPRRCRALT